MLCGVSICPDADFAGEQLLHKGFFLGLQIGKFGFVVLNDRIGGGEHVGYGFLFGERGYCHLDGKEIFRLNIQQAMRSSAFMRNFF